MVDEFYKLDPTRKDERSITLNAAVYRLLNRANQFFFLGPNIDRVIRSDGSRWSFTFLPTRFSTVAVDTFDFRASVDKENRLRTELLSSSNWPALVFVSAPDKANALSETLLANNVRVGRGEELATWMEMNYGRRWELSESVRAGIGVHHGRIPRALASRFIALFNKGLLPIMLCTSTLIEGVNTAAKSVLIYDKTIDRANYDFFTFSNIRGRAGRLGQHHVGKVFLFHNPPEEEDVDVTAPLFGEPDEAPDEYVLHLEERDSTPGTNGRIDELTAKLGLSAAELRRFSNLRMDVLEELRAAVESALGDSSGLRWSGHPSYDRVLALTSVVCAVRRSQEFGCRSAKHLAMYINKLRRSRRMVDFFAWHGSTYVGDPQQMDNVFKFLRTAEYSLPEYFAAVELFVSRFDNRVNYGRLLSALPRWFRAQELKILEEQGVPIQISERFFEGETVASLQAKLRSLALRRDSRLSKFECEWILEALPTMARVYRSV